MPVGVRTIFTPSTLPDCNPIGGPFDETVPAERTKHIRYNDLDELG